MIYFIVNPNCRASDGSRPLPVIRRVMRQRSIPFRLYESRYPGHARRIAADITAEDPGAVIAAVGGDGTVHEVVNGLACCSGVTLGHIPCGTSADFARGMRIPRNTEKALSAIISPKRILKMDVGRAESDGNESLFAVSSGIGFNASVSREILTSSVRSHLGAIGAGSAAYPVIAAKQSLLYDPFTVKIRMDGERQFTFPNTWFVSVMNQKYESAGCRLAPDASPSDGILDVMVLSGVSRFALASLTSLTRSGVNARIPGSHILRCRSVRIIASKKSPIHLDGESGGIGAALSAEILPGSLRVITG